MYYPVGNFCCIIDKMDLKINTFTFQTGISASEYWTKLVECNALQVAVHFENCTALLRIAVHLLPKM